MAISLRIPDERPPLDPKLARLVTDAFLNELSAKAYEYYIGANNFKDASGKRFQKEIVRSDLWNAIARLRQAAYLKEQHSDNPELAPGPEFTREAEAFISSYYLQGCSEGNLVAQKDAIKLQELFLEARPSSQIPWYYDVGMAAWELLIVVHMRGGRIPTKKDVKKRAIDKRKKREGGRYDPPERWDRIFSALDLGDLPTAQGEGHPTRHST
jgi:hypothetical protein